MSEYIFLVIGTVLISTFLTAILPEGKMLGTIKGTTKLVCVLTMISPIVQFLHKGTDSHFYKNVNSFFEKTGIEMNDEFIQYYSELRIDNAAKQIENTLQKEFSIQTAIHLDWAIEKAETYFLYENEAIKIQRIRLQITEKIDEEVKSRVIQYIKDNYCSEVLIE